MKATVAPTLFGAALLAALPATAAPTKEVVVKAPKRDVDTRYDQTAIVQASEHHADRVC